MKIVYISNSIIPSRAANSIHVMKMCHAFADNEHEVVLLAPDVKEQYEKGVDNVYEYYGVKKNFVIKKLPIINIRYMRNFYYAFHVQKELRLINPDLVYGRDLFGCFIGSFYYKTVFEAHAPINNIINQKLLEKMTTNKFYEKTVVISLALKNIILEKQKINPNNILVAHDGADEVIDFDAKIELKGNKNNPQIGYVGHLYKGRGIEIIIECAKQLKDLSFHIVGGTNVDIEYWKKISNNSKIENIFFYGFVSPKEASKFRNAFDIVLAPYANKVSVHGDKGDTSKFMSPLKIFEYMAHKKSIIVSDLPVLREVLNTNNSILVNSEDSTAWVTAIQMLKDETIRSKLSNQALKDFKKYTWKNRVKFFFNNI